MALSANRLVPGMKQHQQEGGGFVFTYPVLTGVTIYEGALVTLNASGYARPLNVSDTKFAGVASEFVASGSDASGVHTVKVHSGTCIKHAIGSTTIENIGAIAYASDDATMTLDSSGTLAVGWVQDVEEANVGTVLLKPPGVPIS